MRTLPYYAPAWLGFDAARCPLDVRPDGDFCSSCPTKPSVQGRRSAEPGIMQTKTCLVKDRCSAAVRSRADKCLLSRRVIIQNIADARCQA